MFEEKIRGKNQMALGISLSQRRQISRGNVLVDGGRATKHNKGEKT